VKPELGIRVHLRNVETLNDVGDVTAPRPVEPGDLVATVVDVCVEVVLVATPSAFCVPVLARRIQLTVAAS
jgi:hypothetical protein